MIAANVAMVRERIARAAGRAGRNPAAIELVASTKGRSAVEIEELISAGVRVIGENRVQEAREKFPRLAGRVSMHMIGHLQRNKVCEALAIFDMIHSVDSLRLAEEIEREGRRKGRATRILLEVNVAGEESKYGLTPDELLPLVSAIAPLQTVHVEGLMTMAPFSPDPEAARPFFRALRLLAAETVNRGIPGAAMRHLSMGMTQDFEVAVEEGATMVRIGTALFGDPGHSAAKGE